MEKPVLFPFPDFVFKRTPEKNSVQKDILKAIFLKKQRSFQDVEWMGCLALPSPPVPM